MKAIKADALKAAHPTWMNRHFHVIRCDRDTDGPSASCVASGPEAGRSAKHLVAFRAGMHDTSAKQKQERFLVVGEFVRRVQHRKDTFEIRKFRKHKS